MNLLDYQEVNDRVEWIEFSFDLISTNVGFPSDTLMEEIKKVVMEKDEFDYRYKPIPIEILECSIYQEFDTQNKMKTLET